MCLFLKGKSNVCLFLKGKSILIIWANKRRDVFPRRSRIKDSGVKLPSHPIPLALQSGDIGFLNADAWMAAKRASPKAFRFFVPRSSVKLAGLLHFTWTLYGRQDNIIKFLEKRFLLLRMFY